MALFKVLKAVTHASDNAWGSSQGIKEPSTRRHGPYRSQAQIPPQTLHNRKKWKLLEAPSCTHAGGSVEEPPSITASETPSAVDTPKTSSTLLMK